MVGKGFTYSDILIMPTYMRKYYIDYLLENPPIEKRRHFLLSNYGSALGLVRLIVRNLRTPPHSLNCYPD